MAKISQADRNQAIRLVKEQLDGHIAAYKILNDDRFKELRKKAEAEVEKAHQYSKRMARKAALEAELMEVTKALEADFCEGSVWKIETGYSNLVGRLYDSYVNTDKKLKGYQQLCDRKRSVEREIFMATSHEDLVDVMWRLCEGQ